MSEYWRKKLTRYTDAGWSRQETIFATQAVKYFPDNGKVLELGAGLGRDSAFFASRGYDVTATDFETDTLKGLYPTMDVQTVDMSKPLPFADMAFDVVYAHLAIHYFDDVTTRRLTDEMWRILRPGGIVAVLVNSTADPECGQGRQIEENFFEIDGIYKRYFTPAYMRKVMAGFECELLGVDCETRKDMTKGVHQLIGFIGRK